MRQSDLQRFYTDKAHILRRNRSEDKYGGTTDVWEKMEWCIPCRLYSGRSVQTSGGQGYRISIEGKEYPVTTNMLCDLDADLQVGDKVITEDDVYMVLRTTIRYRMRRQHHKIGILSRIESDGN